MSYLELFTPEGSSYFLDYQAIDYIIEASTFKIELNNNSSTKVKDLGFMQPDIYLVESDPNGAARKARYEKTLWCGKYSIPTFAEASSVDLNRRNNEYFKRWTSDYRRIDPPLAKKVDIEKLREYLLNLEVTAVKASEDYKEKWDKATKRGTESIKSTINTLEWGLEASKLVRDISTEFLIVGAVALGPLGAIAVKSGANVLKGVATWQDTGNIGAGVLTAGVGIITTIIPAPKGASSKVEGYALLLIQKKTEFAGKTMVGVVRGKSVKEAAVSATVDMVGSKAFGTGIEKISGKLAPDLAKKVLSKALDKNTVIPVKILKASIDPISGKLTNLTSARLIELAKNDKSTKKQPQAKISSESLVDYAIIGPDGSHARFNL